jgi:transposase-like protein
MAKSAKRRGPSKLYTPAEKARILAAAAKEELTGEQVAKKFGIAQLTFYRWRGPVRSDAVGRRASRGPEPRVGTGKFSVDEAAIRQAVRAQLQRLLPQLIQEEVEAALRWGLGEVGNPAASIR